MLTAEQTTAIGRKYGPHRYRFCSAHEQHDSVKVNSTMRSVKIFFTITDSHSRIVVEPASTTAMRSRDALRYLLLFAFAAVPVAGVGQLKPAPIVFAAALFAGHGLLSFATAGRERCLPRDLFSAALLLGCLAISGVVLCFSLTLRLLPPVTPDGHPVMPIAQAFVGTIAGVVCGVALAVLGSLRHQRRDRRRERLVLHAVGALLIVAALVERRWR